MTDPELNELLAIRFDYEGDEVSVREWLSELLVALWIKGEYFSSKRPLGNSDWEWVLARPLADHFTGVSFDADDYVQVEDDEEYRLLVTSLITRLARP